MAGFDDMGIYFADNLGANEANDEFNAESVHSIKRKFKEFLKEFHDGNFVYKYRWVNWFELSSFGFRLISV